MSFESVARQSLYRQTHAKGGDLRSLFDRRLLGRIWRFAARHHRRLGVFVVVSVVSALLGLATPLLAGKVVDEIGKGALGVVVALAAVIAAVAVAEAGVSLVTRWLSSTIGEGLILDLRTAVFDHVQRMPVAFFTRTRTGALVSRLGNDVIRRAARLLRHVLRRHHQHRHPDADAGGHAQDLVAGHGAVAGADAAVPAARPLDRADHGAAVPRGRHPQRDDEHPDDRTLFGAGRDVGQALRQPGHRIARVRGAGRPRPRHRGAHRDAAVGLHELADADVGARAGAGVRARRRAGHRRASADGRDRRAGTAADPAVLAADGAGQRARRDRQCAGQLRARLRGARPRAADPGEARRRAGARRAGVGGVRRRAVLLPVGRQGVAGLPRRGRGAGRPRGRRSAARYFVHRASRARWWRWSVRRGRGSRRSRR